ncbi:hypothetical protein PI124_g9942 [Phytophthora idaei]|nr:hypothetical protein PI125_g6046 [Phytophthora idaei]KAG3156373.1 hypothetical protein PI126_g8793 [Phytophthora idaei]KAG3245309.1 hypothetical protein PI124_g9942 [Phytophthora idaei]
METVALEWISSVEVEPHDVVQFVQRLNNVPEDAVCEIGDIFSRRCRTIGFGNQDERRVRNEVHLSCEPRVAEFLCKKFCKKIQHVTGGEVIQVRCKHVYPGAKCLGKITSRTMKPTSECVEDADQTTLESETQAKSSISAAAVLPIDKVIALIDLLGDQVVDAQETYELFADSDASGPQRMTMLGLTKALSKLCKNGWTAKSSRVRGNRNISAEGDIKITVESLRHLLSRLIASNNVAVKRTPAATTVPFLSYTDFLAVYVAFLANHHSSS